MSIVLHHQTNAIVPSYNKLKINSINKINKKPQSITNNNASSYGNNNDKKKEFNKIDISTFNILSVDTQLIKSNVLTFFRFLAMKPKFI